MAGLLPRGIRCFSCPRASIGAGFSLGCFFSLTGNLNLTRTVGKVTDWLAVNGVSSRPPPRRQSGVRLHRVSRTFSASKGRGASGAA